MNRNVSFVSFLLSNCGKLLTFSFAAFNPEAQSTTSGDMRFSYEAEQDESDEDDDLDFNANHHSSFRAYFSPTVHSLLQDQPTSHQPQQAQQAKKTLRQRSLQSAHDKSQSASNLVSFIDNMQLTVSEPNALNQLETPEQRSVSAKQDILMYLGRPKNSATKWKK